MAAGLDSAEAFDIAAHASETDGSPNAVVEAAAAGLPIVATDIRGCRQVVDHGATGLLVPARDDRALGTALATLLADAGLRAAMSAAAVERARTMFDQQRCIELTLATYRRLLGAKAPS